MLSPNGPVELFRAQFVAIDKLGVELQVADQRLCAANGGRKLEMLPLSAPERSRLNPPAL